MTSIGIIGAGNVGKAFATALARHGIEAILSNSRGPESLKEVAAAIGPTVIPGTRQEAASQETVLVAVHWEALPAALSDLPDLTGKIVIDANNPLILPTYAPVDLGGRLSTDVFAGMVPGARVVRALNHIVAPLVAADPAAEGGQRVLFYSGNDAGAKKQVAALFTRLGFYAVDLGSPETGDRLARFPGGAFAAHNFVRFD